MNAEDNQAAWLWVIKFAEGTAKHERPEAIAFTGVEFDNSLPHQGIVRGSPNGYRSDAAGAYQFKLDTWMGIMNGNVPMTKENQDIAATKLAAGRGVDIRTAPFTRENVAKLAPEWASMPTLGGQSYYGQPVKAYGTLKAIFNKYKPSSFVQQASDHLSKKYGVKPEKVQTPIITKTKPKHPLSILGF